MRKYTVQIGFIAYVFMIFGLPVIISSCGASRAQKEVIEKMQLSIDKAFVDSVEIAYATSRVHTQDVAEGIKVVKIDSCEYILYPQTNYYWNGCVRSPYKIFSIVHKGDCSNKTHYPRQFTKHKPDQLSTSKN